MIESYPTITDFLTKYPQCTERMANAPANAVIEVVVDASQTKKAIVWWDEEIIGIIEINE